MLLTASSRPIRMLSLPLRSNSWLSASTIGRAVRGAAVATGDGDGAGEGAALTSAGVVTAAAAGADADTPLSMLPQFERKASPAGLTAPQLGQTCVPALRICRLGACVSRCGSSRSRRCQWLATLVAKGRTVGVFVTQRTTYCHDCLSSISLFVAD